MRVAVVNGARIVHDIAGPPEAPVVVFVHGFALDLRMWDPQAPVFAERYRVVRYDLRGFGRSSIPEPDVHYQHHADLVGLLDALGVERAALVGLSLGGAVVAEAALHHPGRWTALVFAAAVIPGVPTPELSAESGPIWRAGREDGAGAARERWLASSLFEVANERPDCRAALRQIVDDYSGWGWTHPDPGTWQEPDCAARLGEIDAPALVVVGERETPDLRRTADALVAGIPDATLALLPGVGHLPNMEDPAAFNAAVLAFLDARLLAG